MNKSPLAGKEGKLLQTRVIRDRLFKELDRNVALRVSETDSADTYEVRGGVRMSNGSISMPDCLIFSYELCYFCDFVLSTSFIFYSSVILVS